jgi:hypothetical protein
MFAVTLSTDGGGLATLAANSEPTMAGCGSRAFPRSTFTEGGRFCQYDVGVAPDQVVLASMTGGSPDSWCAAGRAVRAARQPPRAAHLITGTAQAGPSPSRRYAASPRGGLIP